jgi:hypothetical protein
VAVVCALLESAAVRAATEDACQPPFAIPRVYTAADPLRDLRVIDTNHDGKADLLGTDTANTYTVVLLGNGDGTFLRRQMSTFLVRTFNP